MRMLILLFLIVISTNANAQSIESKQLENDIIKLNEYIDEFNKFKKYIIENDLFFIEHYEVFEKIIDDAEIIFDRIDEIDLDEIDYGLLVEINKISGIFLNQIEELRIKIREEELFLERVDKVIKELKQLLKEYPPIANALILSIP